MGRLDREESRKRYRELRDLWNEYDPIGVYDGEDEWPLDEYEDCCGPSLRLLEQGATTSELEAYVYSVLQRMGIEGDDKEKEDFVKKMQEWFQKNWSDTYV
jgi:hypothetical protein